MNKKISPEEKIRNLEEEIKRLTEYRDKLKETPDEDELFLIHRAIQSSKANIRYHRSKLQQHRRLEIKQ